MGAWHRTPSAEDMESTVFINECKKHIGHPVLQIMCIFSPWEDKSAFLQMVSPGTAEGSACWHCLWGQCPRLVGYSNICRGPWSRMNLTFFITLYKKTGIDPFITTIITRDVMCLCGQGNAKDHPRLRPGSCSPDHRASKLKQSRLCFLDLAHALQTAFQAWQGGGVLVKLPPYLPPGFPFRPEKV